MRLVEAVRRKALELAEDLLGNLGLDPASHGALEEVRLDALHLGTRAVLRHRPAKRIGLGKIETGDRLCNEQHLLLVDDDAVGVLECLEHPRVRHAHVLEPMPTTDEGRDHLGFEWTGSEERDRRDDVLELARLQACVEVALPAALELEHPDGVGARDHAVDGRVVFRQLEGLRHRCLAYSLPCEFDRVADRRVHPKPQDVHLHEAECLDVVLVVLRDDNTFRCPLERCPRSDGLARDDEAAEMRAQVHRGCVELFGEIDEHAPAALVSKWVVRALGIGRDYLSKAMR